MTDPIPNPADADHAPTPLARQRLITREDFMTLTKARLSTLVVVTTFVGYWLHKGSAALEWGLLHTIIGTTLTAFAAGVFNQVMEMDADAKMHRTASRPLPARRLSPSIAFGLGWIMAALGIVHLGRMVNVESAILAGSTLLVYLFIYTPLKRRSSTNTLIGAVSGALPPVIGWVGAAGPSLAEQPVRWDWLTQPQAQFLFWLLFFWQLPHFVAINWMYRDEYIRGGFAMWSNDDASGQQTSRLALLFSLPLIALAFVPPAFGFAHWAFAPIGAALGFWLTARAWQFCQKKDRPAARKVFFTTLFYLPLILLALCVLRTS